MSIFSENLCYFREKQHILKGDMAKRLSVSSVTYGYYESGVREPKIATLYEITKILDIDFNQLLTARVGETSSWAIEFKNAVDDGTGFLVSNITDTSISLTRVNFNTIESKDKNQRFIHVTESNTLTFKTEDIRELFQHCTQYVGVQIFSNTLKSLFVQHGLADVIIGADAFLPGKGDESSFVEVDTSMYPATKGLPSPKDNT